MQSSRGLSPAFIILLALIFGLAGGGLGAYVYVKSLPPPADGDGGTVTIRPQPIKVVTSEDAVIEAVKRVSPGVVKITSTRVVEPSNPFELFFGLQPREQEGIGSGFIFEYDDEKLILTNIHVIGGADRLVVKTVDGKEFEAEKLGADPSRDLAVIRPIDPPDDLVPLALGNSEEVSVGQRVIAVGNPFGFENTVTDGIISAQGWRQINDKSRYVIQTDAAINSGNSGGPLVDLGGNVIGINFAIFSPTKTSLGIGFAIPVNQAKEMLYFLVNRGPWLGLLNLRINSPGLAKYLGLRTDAGIVVLNVAQFGPAARAGIEPGDVIVEVAGQPVATPDDLQKQVRRHKIGDTISLTIQRLDQQEEIKVKAGKIPDGYY